MSAKEQPWLPADYDEADAYALQALSRGEAQPHQQARALKFIVNDLCGTYDLSYRPGSNGERDTAFAEGGRAVGLQIVKLLALIAKGPGNAGPREQGETPDRNGGTTDERKDRGGVGGGAGSSDAGSGGGSPSGPKTNESGDEGKGKPGKSPGKTRKPKGK